MARTQVLPKVQDPARRPPGPLLPDSVEAAPVRSHCGQAWWSALPCTGPRASVKSRAMRRVVVDSNAMDPLMDLLGAYDAVRAAVDQGDLEILFTHVTVEELAAIPDYERRCRLLIFLIGLGRLVPTGAFIVGASRLDFGRLCDDEESVRLLIGQGVTHLRDALIGATALVDGCALVTYDSRLTARARDRGVEVLTTDELLAKLGFQAPQTVQPITGTPSNYPPHG